MCMAHRGAAIPAIERIRDDLVEAVDKDACSGHYISLVRTEGFAEG